MPNLKDIRRRIRSVKSTQKITQAMRMVAAAKVKRAETQMRMAQPYEKALEVVSRQVFAAFKRELNTLHEQLDESRYGRLFLPRPVRRVALVVVASDRGLCGAYNASVLRRATALLEEYQQKEIAVRVYLVGNKAIQFFRKRYPDVYVMGQLSGVSATPSLAEATSIVDTLLDALTHQEVDRLDVLSTRFRSMVSYKVERNTLFPVAGWIGDNTVAQEGGSASDTTTTEPVVRRQATAPQPEWLIEPSLLQVVDQLLPMYLKRLVLSFLMESATSELAARMTAMANATDNAKDMILRLSRQYNKARQASITQEIMEIVGGAEALK